MELKLNLDYNQLLKLVRQLPENQMRKLVLEANVLTSKSKSKNNSRLQELLLSAPTMSDEQYEEFLDNRKRFNKWRED